MAGLLGGLGGGGGGGGPLGLAGGLTGGLTGGGGPLGNVSGLAGGLTGDGGPLGAVGGLTGGLTGGGGPLGAVGGLTGGLTGDGGPLGALGGLTGGLTGDGGPLGAVSGLTGGLLGGGEGLNLIGLVGIGSDDPALLDLNPAQKKTVKAQKAAQAKQNEQKRQAAMKQLQDQVNAQGGRATPQQQSAAKQLQESQFLENAEMQKLDQVLGPTDPVALQQALAQPSSGGGYAGQQQQQQQQPGSLPSGTYQAYLIDPQTRQPTHLVTFQPINSSDAAIPQNAGGLTSTFPENSNNFLRAPGSGLAPGAGEGGPAAGAGGAGDLLGGLLGSGQGLNVAGILAIGSDEKALLDLNPATKKEERIKQAQELQRQQKIQKAQMQSLRDQVARQNGQPTAAQQQQYNTVQRREQALKQAAQKLDAAERGYGQTGYAQGGW